MAAANGGEMAEAEDWIDVGSAETFRDEDVTYATRIWRAGGRADPDTRPPLAARDAALGESDNTRRRLSNQGKR